MVRIVPDSRRDAYASRMMGCNCELDGVRSCWDAHVSSVGLDVTW